MQYSEIAREVFQIEIEQMQLVQGLISESFDQIVQTIIDSQGRVVVTGMGKSGLIGSKISATLASTGTRSFFMHPGDAYHGDLGMVSPSDIIVAISNSGETEELIRLLSYFKESGNKVIAMTGNENSTLKKYSDFFLNIHVKKEACPLALAPTSSTTVTAAMGDALAVALMRARDFKAENFARFHPGGSLGRKLLLKVKDIMQTQDLPLLKEEDTFETMISVVTSARLGLGIVTDNNKVVGVVTDGDIRRVLKQYSEEALSMNVGNFCTKNPKTIDIEEKVVVAEELMQKSKITTLLALENEQLRGVVHLYNL